jgi:hypothetical protein
LDYPTGLAVYSNNGGLTVKASDEMTSITIYGLLGRKVYQSGRIQTNEFNTMTLNLKNQMLIVKAVFEKRDYCLQ